MPAEYMPHRGTIMIWPVRKGSWPYGAKKAQEALMAKMPPASLAQARTLAASYARQYVTAH